MAVIYGSPARFAVEYELTEKYGGVWMWGHLRYWCGGEEVGDFGITTSLRDALFQLEGTRRDIGKRQNVRFQNMSPLQMVRLLDAGLFGRRDISPSNLPEEEEWARHNITPWIDVFDHWGVYVVEWDPHGRMAWGRLPFMQVSAIEVNAGEIDEVLARVLQSLDAVYERERALELAGESANPQP
jgi:hypothetical protein